MKTGYEEHPNYEQKQTENKRFYTKSVIETLTLIFAGAVAWFTYNIMLDTGKEAGSTSDAVSVTHDALRFQKYTESLNRIEQKERNSINARSQALRDSLSIASFKTEMNAYVTADWDVNNVERSGDTISVVWVINNFGKTPARKLRSVVRWSVVEISKDSLKKIKLPTIFISLGSTPYHKTSTAILSQHFDPIVRDSIINGIKPLYIGIIIEYEDIFHHVHHTYGHVRLEINRTISLPIPDDD